MPSRNVVKQFAADSYYHVYSRGVYGQDIFLGEKDYSAFLNNFKRYLSKEPAIDKIRRPLPHLRGDIDLLAYCLMPSHFHLLVYNKAERGLTNLMSGALTAYSMYFNREHQRHGRLFESTYKASLIQEEPYLWHISRYIHLNPQDLGISYKSYSYSSYGYYLKNKHAEWINPDKILKMHNDENSDYEAFMDDYRDMRTQLKGIQHMLAN